MVTALFLSLGHSFGGTPLASLWSVQLGLLLSLLLATRWGLPGLWSARWHRRLDVDLRPEVLQARAEVISGGCLVPS